jgi:hypothetical protein
MLESLENSYLKQLSIKEVFKTDKYLFNGHQLEIGMIGFEPTTPSSRTKCATKLRYIPLLISLI